MNHKFRCVFDTNTLISALLFRNSVPGRALIFAIKESDILISAETAEELVNVLSRKKFNKYITARERQEFFNAFLLNANLVNVITSETICRDPKDDKFINLAISGKATHIITGDSDLLSLKSYREIKIVNSEMFLSSTLQVR